MPVGVSVVAQVTTYLSLKSYADLPASGRNSGHRWTSQKCLLADISAPRFAERDLWNTWSGLPDHSALRPANLITLPHFSISAAIWSPNSAGVKIFGVVATSASRALMVGFTSPALISRLSRSMISGGVPLGTPTPTHTLASYPGTVSPIVGTSGTGS